LGQQESQTNMKTNLLSLASALAASAALILSFAGVVAAGVAFTVAGVLAIFALDYRRTLAPIGLPAEVVPSNPTRHSISELRLAA